MVIRMNTDLLTVLNPGLYGTLLGDAYNDIREEECENFISTLIESVENEVNELFSTLEDIKVTVNNGTFHKPQYYNYYNDWVEFDMNIPDDIRSTIKTEYAKTKKRMLNFFKENYSSRDGFISLMPWSEEKFEKVLYAETCDVDFIRMIAMYFMWKFRNEDLSVVQWQLEDDLMDAVSQNGWDITTDDEMVTEELVKLS